MSLGDRLGNRVGDRLGDRLGSFLAGSPVVDGAGVVGWRFELSEGQVARVGMRAGRLGGPYEAPSVSARLGGSIELRWSDERVSRASLRRDMLDDLPNGLAGWRAEAYPTGLVAPPAPPAMCPAVRTFDPDIAALAGDRPAGLVNVVLDVARALGEGSIDAADVALTAGATARRVATSAGFDATWDETAYGLELSAEELHGDGYARRRVPREEELARLVADVAATVRALRQEDALPSEPRGVLFTPSALDALLARFLGTNLDGRAVLRGQSRFSPDDVRSGLAVLRPDLDLIVDTTLPFELATAPCSGEGVPAGPAALVRGGRLATPLLDRERAARLGLSPTPAPRGRPSLLLETSERELDVDAALQALGEGVVVRALLGLHTQNARRGDYAVVVPIAQVVRGGRRAGRASVRVRGNLFALLAAPETRLVRFPDSTTPGLLALDRLGVMPA